jgi:hypothetical protein
VRITIIEYLFTHLATYFDHGGMSLGMYQVNGVR